MKDKFLSEVYKTAKPWVLGVIVIGIIIGIYFHPENLKNILNSRFSEKIIFNLVNAILFSIGLNLWDFKKFPLNSKRIFSLFLISLSINNFLQ